jgi:hypothetical protein
MAGAASAAHRNQDPPIYNLSSPNFGLDNGVHFRVRKIISEPGSNIAAYDQLAWCSALDYAQQPTADSLRVFTAVREANVRLYERLTPEQWNAYGIHSERGEESVKQLLTLLAGHDRNHISQI